MNKFWNITGRLAALLVAVILLLLASWLPQARKTGRLRVSPGVWPGAEAIVLAHAEGKLPAAEFQLVELPWSSAAMRALGSGAADAAVVTLDAVLRMREGGQDLRVLMVLDESAGADMVLARQDVTDIKALNGCRVGVDVSGVGAYLLMNALEGAGMTMSDVRLVPLTQPEMEQAVADGAVDAVLVSEPWSSRLKRAGWHAVYDSKQLSIPIMRVLAATREACEQSRPGLVALLRAQMELTPRVRGGTSFDSMDLVLRREKISRAMFNAALESWRPLDAAENRTLLLGKPPRLARIADEITGQMLRGGLLRSKPAEQPWIDADIIQEAAP